MNRLYGKVAVVTGAALGLGQAIAQRMAEEGAKVLLLDVLDKEGEALAQSLQAGENDRVIVDEDETCCHDRAVSYNS